MLPYIAFASLLAIMAIVELPRRSIRPVWWFISILLIVLVGLRHSVGMDWNNYLRLLRRVVHSDSRDALQVTEPAFAFLLYIGSESGFGIYLTNLIAAAISIGGLVIFAWRSPNPFLALSYAFPYLIIAIFMSGTRQGAALGIIFVMFACWYRLGLVGKVLLVLLATAFHSSAIIFLGFVAMGMRLPAYLKFVAVLGFTGASVFYLINSERSVVYQRYIEGAADAASGAIFHVALVAVPAAIYFLKPSARDRLFPTPFLRHMALAAVLTLLLIPFSTIIASRLSIYWFPMAIYVWAGLPGSFGTQAQSLVKPILALLTVVLTWAWLATANSSIAWVPYSNALFVESRYLDLQVR